MITCNKKCYHTKKLAKKFKKILEARYGRKLFIYKCKICGDNPFHLTSRVSVKSKVYFRNNPVIIKGLN